MRILFLCQYFPPESNAPASRTFEHARHWVRMGHEVTVVCGLPNHPDGIIPEKYRGTVLYREEMDGIRVLRCWLYVTPNRGVIRRSLSFFSFMLSALFFGAFFTGRCDVVAATSPQMLCALAGYVVSWIKRRPFVLEIRDLWPKQIIELGAVTRPLIIGMLSQIELFMYRRACAIVTVAGATRELIHERGIPLEKIHTITNGIDEDFFRPMDRMTPMRKAYGWDNKNIVMYIGTHGMSQGLETILDTAQLLANRPEIHFVFAGSGAERDALIARARQLNLPNIQFLPMQPKELMPECYATADICLVPLKKRDVFLYNIPSKMFEIMACARPIVLGVEGQAKRLLEEAESGLAVEPENPHAFAEAILRLTEDENLRQRLEENGRRHVVALYTRKQNAYRYIDCFNTLLRQS